MVRVLCDLRPVEPAVRQRQQTVPFVKDVEFRARSDAHIEIHVSKIALEHVQGARCYAPASACDRKVERLERKRLAQVAGRARFDRTLKQPLGALHTYRAHGRRILRRKQRAQFSSQVLDVRCVDLLRRGTRAVQGDDVRDAAERKTRARRPHAQDQQSGVERKHGRRTARTADGRGRARTARRADGSLRANVSRFGMNDKRALTANHPRRRARSTWIARSATSGGFTPAIRPAAPRVRGRSLPSFSRASLPSPPTPV